jgi:uncharacterized membrane protein
LAQASFSGPLPPPGMLERYNSVIPNGADRIMKMAEEQAKHRQSLETSVINANLKAQERGQRHAVAVVVVGLAGGVTLIALGKDVAGYVSIIGSLSTMAGVFLLARHAQKKERRESMDRLAGATNPSSDHRR